MRTSRNFNLNVFIVCYTGPGQFNRQKDDKMFTMFNCIPETDNKS